MEKKVKIDCRYFVEMVQEVRSLLRDMRQRLNELERVCDAVCDRAIPDIAAQAELSMEGDEDAAGQE